MLGPESVLYIRMFLNLCPLYPRFTVGWLVNTEISPVWNCLNWIGVRTPKQVAAQKIYGRTLGWGSVGSRRSKASRQRTPRRRRDACHHSIHASLWKKCSKNGTWGPVYGFARDDWTNLKFIECLIGVFVFFMSRWHKWGRNKHRWSKLGSFEKTGNRGSNRSLMMG